MGDAQQMTENPESPIIWVRDLTVGYGDRIVLQQVSFQVARGEILAVLGRSGCGKSTLFKAMIGLVEPMEGEVFVFGSRISSGDNPWVRMS